MVKSSFEDKLTAASSEEEVKAAKQLLKNDALSCAWRKPGGQICAVFRDRNTIVRTEVIPGDPGGADCDACGRNEHHLCAHAVAAIMYCGRFRQEIKAVDDGVSKYSGLKYESLDMLSARTAAKPVSHLSMEALSAFPHVPSKWENAVFAVRLHGAERDYLGNLNNLRQLFFEKKLSIALKLGEFSLQDQQIIRFLAINGEPDGSNILLNSEQTAEFFHSLIGFEHFTRDGRRLYIRGDRCEPVILREKLTDDIRLSPGIRAGETLIPIASAKVITGRSGCWIGRLGEYFFIPATLEIGWLRNFYRTGEQRLSTGRLSENLFQDGAFPVPVIDTDTMELKPAHCRVLLGAFFDADHLFHLQVQYLYHEGVYAVGSGRIGRHGDRCFLRDECAELQLERELEMFGFRQHDGIFTLDQTEAAGTFLDRVLPAWMESRSNLCLEAPLARLCAGGSGLLRAEFHCSILKENAESYLVRYDLQCRGVPVSFRKAAEAVKAGRSYMECGSGGLTHLPEGLSFFFRGAGNAVRSVDEEACTFELPFHSVEYFKHLTSGIAGALPAELAGQPAPVTATPPPDAPDFHFTGELRQYQAEGVEWLQNMTGRLFNVILADEMGLGKTVQVLALLASRCRKKDDPAMVICPSSLVGNWEREAQKFVPDMRVAVMTGTERENRWGHLEDTDLVILSYATARRDAARFKKLHFSFLILDEAQHIKNPGTANSQNCKSIRATHRIVLTGTPLENSSEDLWSIMDFLHPGMLGTFAGFRRFYAGIAGNRELQQDLAARVSPFLLRRTKAQVGQELPPKQERTLFCSMDAEQRALYERVRVNGLDELARMSAGDVHAGTEIFTTLLRLRQICCHPGLLPEHAGDNVGSAKFELLQELVLEHLDSGHKLLLFSQFTSLLAKISAWLDSTGIAYEYLDGSTRGRQTHVDHFNNDPSIPLFLLSLKAGGTGLNLTAADTVVICDPWWNPAVELQAADRTHRIGQTRKVTMLKLLVKDSIEEKILEMQSQKQEIFDNVINNPGAVGGKFSLDELKFLLS